MHGAEHRSLRVRLPSGRVSLGSLLNLAEPQLPHLTNGNNSGLVSSNQEDNRYKLVNTMLAQSKLLCYYVHIVMLLFSHGRERPET